MKTILFLSIFLTACAKPHQTKVDYEFLGGIYYDGNPAVTKTYSSRWACEKDIATITEEKKDKIIALMKEMDDIPRVQYLTDFTVRCELIVKDDDNY